MKYYILTFHRVKNNGSFGRMIHSPMLFDSLVAAIRYGGSQVDIVSTNFRVTEAELQTEPTKNNG